MGRNHAHRLRAAFLVLAVLCLALAQQASAQPPPPAFWNFTISNATGAPVADVDVQLIPSVGPSHSTLGPPIAVSVSSLPNGGSVVVNLPQTYGIAKITANGKCPGQLPANVEITAPLGDYNGQPGDEYPGFCPQAPTGQTDFQPVLIFRKNAQDPTKREAYLAGKWRWDDHWPAQPVKDTKTFP
jgi:hypothetical protein